MTPLGHAALSFCVGSTARFLPRSALLAGSLLPDIDFLLLPFAWFDGIHRVLTHNLLFVFVCAVMAALFVGRERPWALFFTMLVGSVLHLLVDAGMDSNPLNGIGVALWWPFSDAMFSPMNLLAVDAASPGWSDPLGMLPYVLGSIRWELPFYLLAGLLLWRERRKSALA